MSQMTLSTQDVPDATTILGAAKLTGQTAGGWSIGLMEALTGRETADYIDELGQEGEAEVARPHQLSRCPGKKGLSGVANPPLEP